MTEASCQRESEEKEELAYHQSGDGAPIASMPRPATCYPVARSVALIDVRNAGEDVMKRIARIVALLSLMALLRGCDETNAVAWPLVDLPAFPENDEYNFWSMVSEGEQATDVREFLRANLGGEAYYPSSCVSRDGQLYRVFYDDMLPNEEEFPF